MHDLKIRLLNFLSIFKNKIILRIILLSFLISFFFGGIIFYYLWTLAPSFKWLYFILGSYYYDLVKIFWDFIIFSFLIFFIPPLFYLIISFFLDYIVEEVYYKFSKKQNLKIKTLSFMSGIFTSVKIFLYTCLI